MSLVSETSQGLLLVLLETPAQLEEEFNDWYDTEHFPQRCSLPGFVRGRRWVCTEGWPRWLATYELSSLASLQSPEYLAVSGPNSTPWSKRILPRTIGRSRILAQLEATNSFGDGPARCVVLCRFPALPALEQPQLVSQLTVVLKEVLGACRLLQYSVEQDDACYLLIEFDRLITKSRLQFLAEMRWPVDLLNVYQLYHRS